MPNFMIIYSAAIFVIIFTFFLRKDISNFFYTRTVFIEACKNKFIKHEYVGVKKTFLSVLYFYQKVPSNISEDGKELFLTEKLTSINELLIVSNLDGVVNFESRVIGQDEDGNYDIYLIKFIPAFNDFDWFNTFTAGVIAVILGFILSHIEIFSSKAAFIAFIQSFLNNL